MKPCVVLRDQDDVHHISSWFAVDQLGFHLQALNEPSTSSESRKSIFNLSQCQPLPSQTFKEKTQTQNPSSEEIPQKYQRLKPVAFLQQVQVIDAGYTAIFGLELAVRLLASGVGFFYRTLAIEDVEVFDESYC